MAVPHAEMGVKTKLKSSCVRVGLACAQWAAEVAAAGVL